MAQISSTCRNGVWTNSTNAVQQPVIMRFRRRLAAFALEIYDGMTRKLLALPGIGKEAIHIVAVLGGKSVLRAPHFAEHQVAGRLCGRDVSHFAHDRFPS